MVKVNYQIDCSCGQWIQKQVESGDFDKWNVSFKCTHWNCDVYQATKLGWLFGSNAEVDLEFSPQCKISNHKWKYRIGFEGWANGDSAQKLFECCGNRLFIRIQEDHWASFVADVSEDLLE